MATAAGRQPSKEPERVNVHDFAERALGEFAEPPTPGHGPAEAGTVAVALTS